MIIFDISFLSSETCSRIILDNNSEKEVDARIKFYCGFYSAFFLFYIITSEHFYAVQVLTVLCARCTRQCRFGTIRKIFCVACFSLILWIASKDASASRSFSLNESEAGYAREKKIILREYRTLRRHCARNYFTDPKYTEENGQQKPNIGDSNSKYSQRGLRSFHLDLFACAFN